MEDQVNLQPLTLALAPTLSTTPNSNKRACPDELHSPTDRGRGVLTMPIGESGGTPSENVLPSHASTMAC